MNKMKYLFLQGVYSNLVSSVWDQEYVRNIVSSVITATASGQTGKLQLGNIEIPVPPDSIG